MQLARTLLRSRCFFLVLFSHKKTMRIRITTYGEIFESPVYKKSRALRFRLFQANDDSGKIEGKAHQKEGNAEVSEVRNIDR